MGPLRERLGIRCKCSAHLWHVYFSAPVVACICDMIQPILDTAVSTASNRRLFTLRDTGALHLADLAECACKCLLCFEYRQFMQARVARHGML